MLYMVIEKFKHGNARLVGERFRSHGRMLPDGLTFQSSWMNSDGSGCFMVMDTERPELLSVWIDCWADLIDFQIFPVMISADYWANS